MNFLEQLLENEGYSGDVFEGIDPEITDAIEESTLPMDVLIESVATDIDNSIIQAMETYQMGCIIGGARVVSESAGAERAQELLEGALGNFWEKIKSFFRKIKDWFLGLFKKVRDKKKESAKTIKEEYDQYIKKFKENFDDKKYTYTGFIPSNNISIDDIGAERIKNTSCAHLNKMIDSLKKSLNVVGSSEDSAEDYCNAMQTKFDDAMRSEFGIPHNDPVSGDSVSNGLLKAFDRSDDDKTNTHNVSRQDWDKMESTIKAAMEVGTFDKIAKSIDSSMKDMLKTIDDIEKKYADDANKSAVAQKMCSKAASIVNSITSITNTCISKTTQVVESDARSYIAFMKKVANNQKGDVERSGRSILHV